VAGAVRIFVAGASGVIGARLVPLFVSEGHVVAGMTRSAGKAGLLAGLGAEPVIADVFDTGALTEAVVSFAPEVVFHQLTDLPDTASEIAAFGDRNDRMRSEGTRNLLAAADAARAARVIAQSVSWELPSATHRAVTAAHERAVLAAGGVVIRYGQLYGPGTYYPSTPPDPPRIHVDDAARQSLPALTAPPGVTLVADDRAGGGSAAGGHPAGNRVAGNRKDRP
jgi:nucleoside-diphosphate-sugar epimerase